MVNNKILIVEDDEIVSQLIGWRVTEMGYRVCGKAANGPDAIILTNESSPDLILMDITLQGNIDGIETAKIIQQHFSIPIIFLTASSDEKLLDRIAPLRPAGYIIKPFTDNDLRVALRLALS